MKRGYEIWPSTRFDKKRIDKAALALLFLTPAAAANDAVNRAISYTAQSDHPLLAVHLSPTALTPAQRLQLNSQQGILRHECASDSAFFEKLLGSSLMRDLQVTPAQKRAAAWTTWSLVGGIVFAVAMAVYLALGTGAVVQKDSLLAGLGYTGRMADITQIYLYGDQQSKTRSEGTISGIIPDFKTGALRMAYTIMTCRIAR